MPLATDNGLFLPNTKVFNPEQAGPNLSPEDQVKYNYILQYMMYNDIANVVNLKDSAIYVPVEFIPGQLWFRQSGADPANPFTYSFRMVVNFGTLPNAASKSVAHNITGLTPGQYSWTKIIGSATDAAGNGLPLPFSSPILNENIKLTVDSTNVTITTAIDYTAYTNCYIILEYLKDSF